MPKTVCPLTVNPPVVEALIIVVTPVAETENIDAPVEEATLNGFCVPAPCTLKVIPVDVAPTPAKVPVSRRRPVASVDTEVQRARKSLVPPDRVPEIPNDEVATQRVEVPDV